MQGFDQFLSHVGYGVHKRNGFLISTVQRGSVNPPALAGMGLTAGVGEIVSKVSVIARSDSDVAISTVIEIAARSLCPLGARDDAGEILGMIHVHADRGVDLVSSF